MDAWVLDPAGQEVWRRAAVHGGDPFSFAAQGPRVRQGCASSLHGCIVSWRALQQSRGLEKP